MTETGNPGKTGEKKQGNLGKSLQSWEFRGKQVLCDQNINITEKGLKGQCHVEAHSLVSLPRPEPCKPSSLSTSCF